MGFKWNIVNDKKYTEKIKTKNYYKKKSLKNKIKKETKRSKHFSYYFIKNKYLDNLFGLFIPKDIEKGERQIALESLR